MKTLLEKAKEVETKKKKSVDEDEFSELAIAWLKGEITNKQAYISYYGEPKTFASGNILYLIAVSLRNLYKKGKIKICEK
jgi:hypothetical protein